MRLRPKEKPQLGDRVEAVITTGGGRERVVRGEVVSLLSTQFVVESGDEAHDIIRFDGEWDYVR